MRDIAELHNVTVLDIEKAIIIRKHSGAFQQLHTHLDCASRDPGMSAEE